MLLLMFGYKINVNYSIFAVAFAEIVGTKDKVFYNQIFENDNNNDNHHYHYDEDDEYIHKNILQGVQQWFTPSADISYMQ